MSFPTGPTVGVFAPNTNSANTPPPNADNLSGAGARRNKTQSQFLNTIATLAELAASQRKEIVEARAAYDKATNFSSNLMSECVAATNRAVAAELECSRLLESLASVRRENDNLEAAKLDLQTRLQKEMSQTKALRRTIASKNKQSPERSPRQPTTSPENAQTPKSSATHTLVSTPPTSRPELQPGTPPARAARRHSVTLLGHPEDRIGGGPLDILIATTPAIADVAAKMHDNFMSSSIDVLGTAGPRLPRYAKPHTPIPKSEPTGTMEYRDDRSTSSRSESVNSAESSPTVHLVIAFNGRVDEKQLVEGLPHPVLDTLSDVEITELLQAAVKNKKITVLFWNVTPCDSLELREQLDNLTIDVGGSKFITRAFEVDDSWTEMSYGELSRAALRKSGFSESKRQSRRNCN